MATNIGNWFENGNKVLDRTQNLNADGDTFTGDVTGDVTGDITGGQTLPDAVVYGAAGAITLTDSLVHLDGFTATAAMTLAAPTGANIGKLMYVSCINSSNVCDIDVTTGIGAQTLTFTVGETALLLATNFLVWDVVSTTAAIT